MAEANDQIPPPRKATGAGKFERWCSRVWLISALVYLALYSLGHLRGEGQSEQFLGALCAWSLHLIYDLRARQLEAAR